jgi:hypothetical protein
MGKEFSVPGRFPANRVAKRSQINGGNDEILLAGEVPIDCFRELRSRREMDETIGLVDRGSLERTRVELAPLVVGQHLVGDVIGHALRCREGFFSGRGERRIDEFYDGHADLSLAADPYTAQLQPAIFHSRWLGPPEYIVDVEAPPAPGGHPMNLRAIRDHLNLARFAVGQEHPLSAPIKMVGRHLTPGDSLWRDDAIAAESDLLAILAQLERLPEMAPRPGWELRWLSNRDR